MASLLTLPRIAELFRFYQAALVNTAFGYGLYALLVWSGANLFVAQIIAHLLGMTFNYFTYSRHVFRDRQGGKGRFIATYGVNYLVNLSLLALFTQFVPNPYAAGLLATICASLINFVVLRQLVFVEKTAE